MSTHDLAEGNTSILTSDGAEGVYNTCERCEEVTRSARARRKACKRLASGMKIMHECIATMHNGLSKENDLRPRVQVVTQNNYQMPTPITSSTEARPQSPVDYVQGEGGIRRSNHAGPAPQAESLALSRDVFGPNQWQAPAPPIQMIHRSDQNVQGSQPPTSIFQHADSATPGSLPELKWAWRAPSMATYEPDFPEGEANTSVRGPEGIHGGRKRNRGIGRRARARRAQALRRLQETTGVAAPGSIPTPDQSTAHSLNQPRQVWQPRTSQNVQLLPVASPSTPYPAGVNMNVYHQTGEGGEPQAGTLLSLAENFCPNQLQDAPLNGILHTPSQRQAIPEAYHQFPPMHNNLPAINTPYPNIDAYYVHGYVPYPPGFVLQYPGGIVQYPYVLYYIPPNWVTCPHEINGAITGENVTPPPVLSSLPCDGPCNDNVQGMLEGWESSFTASGSQSSEG